MCFKFIMDPTRDDAHNNILQYTQLCVHVHTNLQLWVCCVHKYSVCTHGCRTVNFVHSVPSVTRRQHAVHSTDDQLYAH